MQARPGIYLDSNAGAPLRPEVREALRAFLEGPVAFNPSSQHSSGRAARRALSGARESVARSLGTGTASNQILFTSSGTESIQWAIRSAVEPFLARGGRAHWITTPVEHEATLRVVDGLRERGADVTFLPVDSCGRPDAQALREAITGDTRLISVIWVNNETGVITDVAEIAQLAEERRVPLHLDGAQAWGKLPLTLEASGASYVSFSGSKIGAMSGTGVLWRSPGARIEPMMKGAQEGGLRGGTENLLGIVSLGFAAQGAVPLQWAASVGSTRERLERMIVEGIPGARINGSGAPRVANTINLSFEGVEEPGLVAKLDLAGFAVSAGAACSSGTTMPSHVLKALGLSDARASSAIRVSLDSEMLSSDCEDFVKALAESVRTMRKGHGVGARIS